MNCVWKLRYKITIVWLLFDNVDIFDNVKIKFNVV